MNHQVTALLGLLTETSLHAGAGSSVGGVDLPIQREGHNGWPCVFGSAVKGALRDKAESVLGKENSDVVKVFGADSADASDQAGAIAVGDARLLLLPVRSLTSAFKWVTCIEALKRLQRDADRLGVKYEKVEELGVPKDETALSLDATGTLFLEEYRFTLNAEPKLAEYIKWIAKLMNRTDKETELKKRLVIVSDDMFAHLAQAAVPINAHIALNSETKTTKKGALWYEETLPPETLLYVPLLANKSRNKVDKSEDNKSQNKTETLEANEVMEKVTGLFDGENAKPYLQLGGNETVGMGWCSVEVVKGV